MHLLDLIILIPLLYFLYKGFQKGLIIEIGTLLALIVAIIGAMELTYTIVNFTAEWYDDSSIAPYISFVIAFLIVFFLIQLLARAIEKVLKVTQLNLFNRVAGAIFGGAKVIFIASLLLWLADQSELIEMESKLRNSISYRYIKNIAPFIIDQVEVLLPFFKGIIQDIQSFFSQMTETK